VLPPAYTRAYDVLAEEMQQLRARVDRQRTVLVGPG
jgi:hypothetical protein